MTITLLMLHFLGSIISKKAAEKINALIIDVKCGNGAFMKTIDEGRNLAKALVRTRGLFLLSFLVTTRVDSRNL